MKTNESIVSRFFDFVEIKTKITSLFAFLLALAWLFYLKQPIRIPETVLFFFSMMLLDLATTGINNYIDTKTNDQILAFSRRTGKSLIFGLLMLATGLGVWLAWRTDLVVWLVGGVCFVCGVFYTYGPLPISRMPLGELFSGVFYGLVIPFILLYVNQPAGTYLSLAVSPERVRLDFMPLPLLVLVMLCIPPMATTANIMLANNICDVPKDVAVGRHTLPYYLGAPFSLKLFAGLYYLIYLDVVVMVALRILPVLALVFLLTLLPVRAHIRAFVRHPDKTTTFNRSILNYLIIMAGLIATVVCSGVWA